MADFSYHENVAGNRQIASSGYRIATPLKSRNSFRYILSLIAACGILVAGIGLGAGIITARAWAAGIFVVGVGLFCIAGYLARHVENVRRRSVQWHPIT